ncbi:hypothetical protein FHS43_000571 [Streptosporangium becharense]|uniref:HK97 gp10 family phage protein n=1 Tax=Streptosporangium becharense TaxID=1816182 RepID=A0A7W9IN69_9ACTN|nr:hypothetical protein [Streptosporangium becharense]MBB2909325.1 hypothetical protein [Streptosporangium becharense]MBB5823772.1 hypothetical protein [Streptosporangium becharense]
MVADVRVTGAEQMRKLAADLKRVDKTLAAKLRKTIRDAARPAVADAKTAVRSLPVTGAHGGGGTARTEHNLGRARKPADQRAIARARARSGLRRTIAAAIKTDIRDGGRRAGVRIIVDGSKLPADQRTLPRRLNSKKGWRHPLFGNRKHWYAQKGKPWFEPSIKRHADRIRKTILAAMDEIARELDNKQ